MFVEASMLYIALNLLRAIPCVESRRYTSKGSVQGSGRRISQVTTSHICTLYGVLGPADQLQPPEYAVCAWAHGK